MSVSKKKYGRSVVSLALCIVMLIGTTFAWFFENINSGNQKIVAGKLDIEVYWAEDFENGTWYNVEESGHDTVFGGELWEPGYTQVRYIKIMNAGDLAFKYKLGVKAVGVVGKLADVIDVYCMDNITQNVDGRCAFSGYPNTGSLAAVLQNESSVEASGTILPAGSDNAFGKSVGEKVVAVALKMREDAGNEYQGESIGDGFCITASATQVPFETDSFDNAYDSFPAMNLPDKITATAQKNSENRTVTDTVLENGTDIKALVPAGVLMTKGVSALSLTVTKVKEDGNVIGSDTTMTRVLDVHIEGVNSGNDVPILVSIKNALPRNMNTGAIDLAHKENGNQNAMTYRSDISQLSAHNEYTFDDEGTLTVALCSFSNITLEVDGSNPWDGTADTSWHSADKTAYTLTNMEDLAGLAQLVNAGNDFKGKTVTLGGEYNTWYVNRETDAVYNEFMPIGKGSGLESETGSEEYTPFRGTLNGNGHIINGLYHYYSASPMEKNNIEGLFGSVEDATVKDLTVANSYIVSYGSAVGLIAGYATGTCTFENINLRDNYAATYNNYLAGIVGCCYDYASANANITFRNINVDSSNHFEAKWATYDLPCGGIVGGVYPNSTINFTTCNISCEMSLYHDCCSANSFNAYRYSGMLIGFVRGDAATVQSFVNQNITCNDVTVKYGEWTDLYYCELISAGRGSFTDAHQWRYQRIDKSQVMRGSDGLVTGCYAHNHAANNAASGRCAEDENHTAINIPFNQLFGGGQGVSGITEKTGVTVIANTGSFELAFPNTDTFLYRVGNLNTVKLGSLFKAREGTDIRSSAITLVAKQVQGNVKAVYTPNATDWKLSTVQFSGTGVTQLLLSYYDNTVLLLNLEVINAQNATSSLSASSYDVVLLNDMGISTISVSNGHTLHGNGFTLTATADASCSVLHSDCGYVNLNNGTIDNVKVICPIFENQYIYQSQIERDANQRLPQTRCAVNALNDSTIVNSYISGGRASVFTGDGCNVLTISDSTIAGGTACNMDLFAGKKVILRNVTTSMIPQTCTFNADKQVYGLSILVESSSIQIDIEGTFKQYNWTTKADAAQYVDSTLNTFVEKAFAISKFVHSYNGDNYVNAGFVYINNWDSANVKTDLPANLNDNRTNKEGYEGKDISLSAAGISVNGGAYSVGSSGVLDASCFAIPTYHSTCYSVVTPAFSYSNTVNNIDKTSDTEPYCTYNNSMINVGTKDSTKVLDFSGASVTKDGEEMDVTITVDNPCATVNGKLVTFNTSVTDYTVTFTAVVDSKGYNADGTLKSGSTAFSWEIGVHFAVLTYDPPTWDNVSTTGSNHIWAVKNPNSTDPDYSDAIPVYNGIKVNYYDKSGTAVNKDFTNDTTIPTVNSTNTGASVTFSDGSVLTLSCTHSGYQYQLCNGVVYLYKTTSRNNRDTCSFAITYLFTDPNGNSTASTVKVTYSFSESSPETLVNLSDFEKGKYTTVSSCVVKGTLVTMADGSLKPVEDVRAGDMLRVWDFEKGAYAASPVVFNDSEAEKLYRVVYLTFSDGTEVGVVSEHGFFDATLGKYVYLDENADAYIGHRFIKAKGNGWTTVKLTDVQIKNEVTSVYSPVTYSTLCLYTNGMLSMPGGISGLFNIYQVDVNTMKYDEASKKADIAEYGLFTVEDFGGMIPAEAFGAFNGADLKVAIGKGILSWADIEKYAARYIPLM